MPPTKRAAPRQVARPRDEDEDEPEVPTAQDNGAEEEESPPLVTVRRGRSAARRVMESTSNFAQAFKLTDTPQFIKFLEDDSYANYTRHWLVRQGPTGSVNRSYNCLKSWGKRCPL